MKMPVVAAEARQRLTMEVANIMLVWFSAIPQTGGQYFDRQASIKDKFVK